jgi:hypothetical protein
MKKIIGSEIKVYLKTSDTVVGILVDADENSMYVKSYDVSLDYGIFVVPRDNINYCTIRSLPVGKTTLTYREEEPLLTPQSFVKPEDPEQPMHTIQSPSFLNVYVNEQRVAHISVPPTFDLLRWNDNIMKVVLGNPDVRFYLANKVQKSISYDCGELYIEAEDAFVSSPESNVENPLSDNTFSMGLGGNVATQFLNPAEMVTRLNSMKRVKKTEGKTEQKQEEIINVKS